MKKYFFMMVFIIVFLIVFIIYTIAQGDDSKLMVKSSPVTLLEKIKKRKRLDVVILNAPTVYYVGADDHKGFEYDLLMAFSKSIDVELNLTVVPTVKEALRLTNEGVGDITAASLSVNEDRKKEYPHCTRPEDFRGLKVPDILLSGHHAEIEKWREGKLR